MLQEELEPKIPRTVSTCPFCGGEVNFPYAAMSCVKRGGRIYNEENLIWLPKSERPLFSCGDNSKGVFPEEFTPRAV